jgi:ectoine hydroxylase-related dioxygenase (phytanoyl-CoA dioxygenase family)
MLKTNGVKEFHVNKDELDFAVEEIRTIGYTVIASDLALADLDCIRDHIDRVYAQQVEEIGGEHNLEAIGDANTARCVAIHDDIFIRLASYSKLMMIVERLLGEYFVLMSQNGIIVRSGKDHQVSWHRDLHYQHFTSSRPMAISAMYCIDEFTEETGATHVIPATHKIEVFPSHEYVQRHQAIISAPRGSIIAFDSMLFHRSGHNCSGKTRRGVNHIFVLPFLAQQFRLPEMLPEKYRHHPRLRRLLGYESDPSTHVLNWRKDKLRKVHSNKAQNGAV